LRGVFFDNRIPPITGQMDDPSRRLNNHTKSKWPEDEEMMIYLEIITNSGQLSSFEGREEGRTHSWGFDNKNASISLK